MEYVNYLQMEGGQFVCGTLRTSVAVRALTPYGRQYVSRKYSQNSTVDNDVISHFGYFLIDIFRYGKVGHVQSS